MVRHIIPVVVLLGCSKAPNLAEYDTSEIEATIKVLNTAPGDGASFEVILLGPQTGISPNYIKLTEEAVLTASWGDESVVLEQVTQGVIVYGADFSVSEPTSFNIGFTRPDGEDAPTSEVSLAAPFELGEISSSVAAEGSLDIAWTGGSGNVEILVSGECIQSWTGAPAMADGAISIPFTDLVPVDADNPVGCSLDVQLNNESSGTVDPAWGEGSQSVARVLRTKDAATTYSP